MGVFSYPEQHVHSSEKVWQELSALQWVWQWRPEYHTVSVCSLISVDLNVPAPLVPNK